MALFSPFSAALAQSTTSETNPDLLQGQFDERVKPLLKSSCLDCHGSDEPEAELDLSGFSTVDDVARGFQIWNTILARLEANEMPPEDSGFELSSEQRQQVIDWFHAVRDAEAERTAGDPGTVLARRLSNAEYNYTIRDLTGVDIRPTETFPVDPANEAGFDNSGESLAMSPALLNKFLGAARQVVEHMVLTPDGIAFAPHPVVTNTDRDKYCVKRIVEFYQNQPTDYADYFFAAWNYRLREKLGRPNASLDEFAEQHQVSPKYLATIWGLLNDDGDEGDEGLDAGAGPIATVRSMWQALPGDPGEQTAAREGCAQLRDDVVELRNRITFTFPNLQIEGSNRGSQPFVLWKNRQYVEHRRKFNRDALITPETTAPAETLESNSNQASEQVDEALVLPRDPAQRELTLASFERFASVFPDAFYVSERGRDYVDEKSKQGGEKGRLLSAGFHSMMGYFRDDQPLYDLLLDESAQQQIDRLWQELDFVTSAPMRQYAGFLWFERTDSRFMRDPQFDFARAEDRSAASQEMIERLAPLYLEKARASDGGNVEIEAIKHYFREINAQIRWVESARLEAEPDHVRAVLELAQRAYRRPLGAEESEGLIAFYRSLREEDGLTHEEAIQDVVVSVLMSPHFCYRLDLATAADRLQPLTGLELASRLSYFLWSSMPDDELLEVAQSGDLHRPAVLLAQTRRMLADPHARGLATEFGGNWLDFRRFQEHNSVDRSRFPEFDDELRQAMFEEPIRFMVDVIQRDRSVLDFLYAQDTFVNAALAAHYKIPVTTSVDHWAHVDDAAPYGRGGMLPMAVFLTKNSPGLRTSPVKRGYWVVRHLLGERIPPPPPNVPELPSDESSLGELTLREALARHREHESCAGCHERIDSIGLIFEGFGPVGERRTLDLGGRAVDTSATFPGGGQGDGVEGLKQYLREHRQEEFIDNLCRKLLSFALGRSLLISDEKLVGEMRSKLAANDDRFGVLVEAIVTSPQFLNKRGGTLVAKGDEPTESALTN